jgi:hypothetical protein
MFNKHELLLVANYLEAAAEDPNRHNEPDPKVLDLARRARKYAETSVIVPCYFLVDIHSSPPAKELIAFQQPRDEGDDAYMVGVFFRSMDDAADYRKQNPLDPPAAGAVVMPGYAIAGTEWPK